MNYLKIISLFFIIFISVKAYSQDEDAGGGNEEVTQDAPVESAPADDGGGSSSESGGIGATRTMTIVPYKEKLKTKQDIEKIENERQANLPKPREFNKNSREFADDKEEMFDAESTSFFARMFGLGNPTYEPVVSKEGYRFYFLVGPYSVSGLNSAAYTFTEFFGANKRLMFNFEFELELLTTLGTTGVKIGTGIFAAKANAVFEGTTIRARDTVTFYTLPVILTGVHTLRFYNDQILVPYIEAGAGYFAFMQFQDGNNPKGGRFNMVFGGGLKFLLDWIDFHSSWKLDYSHGINNSYLVFSYRRIQDLSGRATLDYTGSVIQGGFSLDF